MSKKHEQDREVSPGSRGLSLRHDQMESGRTPLTRGRFTLGASRYSAGYHGAAVDRAHALLCPGAGTAEPPEPAQGDRHRATERPPKWAK